MWRRRTCVSCGTTFTSLEGVDLHGSITVKSQGQLQAFQRDKLFMSIFDSLKHRKTALEDATALTDTVISRLYPYMQEVTLEKRVIIETTVESLQRFDKVAATHYEAFHPASTDSS